MWRKMPFALSRVVVVLFWSVQLIKKTWRFGTTYKESVSHKLSTHEIHNTYTKTTRQQLVTTKDTSDIFLCHMYNKRYIICPLLSSYVPCILLFIQQQRTLYWPLMSHVQHKPHPLLSSYVTWTGTFFLAFTWNKSKKIQ